MLTQNPLRSSAWASIAAFSCLGSASAQTTPWTTAGDGNGDTFGIAISGGMDLSGDGVPDVVAGAPEAHLTVLGKGYARGLSGASGATLFTVFGDAVGDDFGRSVALVGDLDQDGRADFVVGAPNDGSHGAGAGLVRVLSGTDGAVLYSVYGAAGDRLGESVCALGDVNGDGFPDFAGGGPRSGALSGFVRVYSGRSGSVLATLNGTGAGDRFGASVSGAGDVNHDSVPDVLVGAPGESSASTSAGRAYVFSCTGGARLFTFEGPSPGAELGHALSSAGDVNADGFPDFIIAAYKDLFGRGSVFVYSGQNGTELYHYIGTTVDDFAGHAVSTCGDVDGDGRDDFMFSAEENFNDIHTGSVFVHSGLDGSLIYTLFGDHAGDDFGLALTRGGDIDGDGLADLVVGAPEDLHISPRKGYVRSYLGCRAKIVTYGESCPGSGGFRPRLQVAGCPVAGGAYTIEISDGLGGAPVNVRFGHGQAEITRPSGCTLYLGSLFPMSLPIQLQGLGPGAGSVVYGALMPINYPPQATITLQAFITDTGVPGGVAATNAIRITLP